MFDKAFNTFYKERADNEIVVESAEGIIKHLTHLEELILTSKHRGLNTALDFIQELLNTFTGHETGHVFTTVKYDGAPAVIAGYNPENNKFFVSTKGIANVNPKVNYTFEDVEQNHGNAPGLVEKLKLGLTYLPAVIKQGVYQGDFMFDSRELKVVDYEGEQLVTFKPNTITYAIPVNSELGKRISASKIGIVFHTKYTGQILSKLTKSSDVNVSEFNQTPDVWVDDAKFKDVSGIVTFTNEETAEIKGIIKEVVTAGNTIKWDSLPADVYTLLNTFINTLIRSGVFVEDIEQTYNKFIEWYNNRATNEISKLKTERGKEQKLQARDQAINNFNTNKKDIHNILYLTKKIEQIKKMFINKYNSAIKTKQFISQPDGSLKVTAPEGYVAVDHMGNMVKLVDRLEFSRANFAVTKGDKFK
jgi:hypothetical protein